MDWQSYTAIGIVGITLVVFVYRLKSPGRSKSGCGKNCGCDMAKKG